MPPINDFSARYPGFQPDNTETLDEEFNRLSIHNGWSKKSKKHSKRRAEFYAAEFAAYYGTDGTKLQGWQALCEEVGIVPAPLSITQCKKALAKRHINLINLVERRRNPDVLLINFKSFAAFRDYTLDGHIYPKADAKKNGFLSALLRVIT